MTAVGQDTLGTRDTFTVGSRNYVYYSLAKAGAKLGDVSCLPFSMKVLLENLLRFEDGVTVTVDDIQALVEKSGGKLIGFYFAYGEADAYVITEYPDRASALALSIAVNASGAVRLTQIELMLPEEVDAAITKLPRPG